MGKKLLWAYNPAAGRGGKKLSAGILSGCQQEMSGGDIRTAGRMWDKKGTDVGLSASSSGIWKYQSFYERAVNSCFNLIDIMVLEMHIE